MTNSHIKILRVNDVNSGPFFHLQQLYEFEFSPITGNEVHENGLYDHLSLQKSWNNHNYHAYLFIDGKKPVGFCVVNLNSQISSDENTKDIAEFFIMPNLRGKQIGEKLAYKIFDFYRGTWEVRQLCKAVLARKFWLKTIASYTDGKFEEKKSEDFYIQTFSNIID